MHSVRLTVGRVVPLRLSVQTQPLEKAPVAHQLRRLWSPTGGTNDPVLGSAPPHCGRRTAVSKNPLLGRSTRSSQAPLPLASTSPLTIDVTVTDRAPLGNDDASPERGQAWKCSAPPHQCS